VVNVGDSRVYRYSPRKGLALITGDHPSAARLEFSAGQVAVQASRTATGDNLGTHPGIAVNSYVVKLGMGDGLLLCSRQILHKREAKWRQRAHRLVKGNLLHSSRDCDGAVGAAAIECGAMLLAERPASLDLAHPGAARRLAEWLCRNPALP